MKLFWQGGCGRKLVSYFKVNLAGWLSCLVLKGVFIIQDLATMQAVCVAMIGYHFKREP